MNPSLRSRTAQAALHRFNELGIRHSVLRGYESAVAEPGRDIDLVAADDALDAITRVVEELKSEFGWDWACRCTGHHEGTSFYFLSAPSTTEPVRQLELHFTRVRWAGLDILSVDELLQHREPTDGGIWTIERSYVAAQRILQFGLSGQLATMKQDYWDDLACAADESDELLLLLQKLLSNRPLAEDLVRRLREEPSSLGDLTNEMRRSFLRAKVGRPSLGQARGLASALANRAIGSRRVPRCGVIAFVDHRQPSASLNHLAELTQPMFLRTEIIEEPDLPQYQDVVNRAGFLLARSVDPPSAAVISRWKAVACILEGPAIEDDLPRIIERFVHNHVSL